MKIEITMPELYKNYMIVGVAIETPKLKGWRLRGIIYPQIRQRTEAAGTETGDVLG